MRILIAPDKFKGSLAAREVAENIALGIRDVLPKAEIEIAAVADGGEGTAEIMGQALDGESVSCRSHDALGRPIDARWIWVSRTKTAVMEMSEAAGLRRLSRSERNPAAASSSGVGEMMADAMKRGARTIVIGLGGSATNDGGFGMARAIGFRFFGEKKELRDGPVELNQLTRILRPETSSWPNIVAAVDVKNPLLGEVGATRMFAAQKGATLEQLEVLEMALTKFADTVARDLGCDFREQSGAGAAGGLGFGLMSFCHAQPRAGFELIADAIGLEQKIQAADVVITGEGRLDMQTMAGKAPAGVAMLARKLGKPVYAIVGEMTEAKERLALFERVFELVQPRISRTDAINVAGSLLRGRAAELARALQ